MNKRARWTILNVEESIIKAVKRYASLNGLRVEKAVAEIIKNSPKAKNLYQEELEKEAQNEVR